MSPEANAYAEQNIPTHNGPGESFSFSWPAAQAPQLAALPVGFHGPIEGEFVSTIGDSTTSPYSLVGDGNDGWLKDALQELAEVDQEAAEEAVPPIDLSVKQEAKRIIRRLARQPFAPAVYPTCDGEVAIHFKSPNHSNSVVILLNDRGHGECYAYTGGSSRRAHYEASSYLPDSFVLEQLRALTPASTALSIGQEGFGTPANLLVGRTRPFL